MASVKQRSGSRPTLRAQVGRIAEAAERKRDFLGAIGLFAVAVLFGWQAWAILGKGWAVARADQVTKWEVHELGEQVETIRKRVQQAVNSATVTAALIAPDDDARRNARVVLKQWLPDMISVDFYRPDLNDVLTSNFSKFGYAKAAMLIQAHRQQGAAPLQSQLAANKRRVLAMALPAVRDGVAVAYAYVQIPMESLLETFRRQNLARARVDLRQGDGRGDALIDSIGSRAVSTAYVPGIAVPDSAFRIASAAVETPILFSRNFWLMVGLAILAGMAGVFLVYAGIVGWERARRLLPGGRRAEEFEEEPAFAQPRAGAAPADKAAIAAKAAAAAGEDDDDADRDTLVERNIFRAYDIRGVVGKTLTKGVARLIGRAIGSEAQQRDLKEIVVARDGRLSGPDLTASLIEGLRFPAATSSTSAPLRRRSCTSPPSTSTPVPASS